MTPAAILLVLGAALAHATWNLLAKRSGGGVAFVWFFSAFAALLYAPVTAGVVFIEHPRIGQAQWLFIMGSGALHLMYLLTLLRGYRTGDLSLIYPVARSTGPLLASAAAMLLLSERPTPLALSGAILIGMGVLILGRPDGNRRVRPKVIGYGLFTGTLIASYTIWDKHAVSSLAIPPLLLDWTNNMSRALVLAPFALRRWETVRDIWQHHRLEVIGVGMLSAPAYFLVLIALTFSPVTYVAPAREISILFATVLGVRFLQEEQSPRRVLAASIMVVGLIALGIG